MPEARTSASCGLEGGRVGDRLAGHAAPVAGEHSGGRVVVEREQCLAEGAGVRRDDDPDLGHLPGSVGTGFVVDDDDVAEQQHAGADGAAGAPGEVLGPGGDAGAELEGVEVDVAEPQRGGAEPVAQRVRVPAATMPCASSVRTMPCTVDGGRPSARGDLAEAHPPPALQDSEDAQRAVDRLDHRDWPLFRVMPPRQSRERILLDPQASAYFRVTFDIVE